MKNPAWPDGGHPVEPEQGQEEAASRCKLPVKTEFCKE